MSCCLKRLVAVSSERCKWLMLMSVFILGESDVECLDLESNDLKDFIDNHSVLMDDYTHTPINTSAIR